MRVRVRIRHIFSGLLFIRVWLRVHLGIGVGVGLGLVLRFLLVESRFRVRLRVRIVFCVSVECIWGSA